MRRTLRRHLVVGPERHAVVQHALTLLGQPALRGAGVLRSRTVDESAALLMTGEPMHLHVTDALFGASARQAAESILRIGKHHPFSVTLHDLPHPGEGERRYRARSQAYAQIAEGAELAIVASRHEHELLRRTGASPRAVAVVPLPVERRPYVSPRVEKPWSVTVLGFIYPGKGYQEVLRAMSVLPPEVSLQLAGPVAAGHDHLLTEVREQAHAANRPLVHTGYLAPAEVDTVLTSATIPVTAHRHLSASASLNEWLEAGRRPLAPEGAYCRELAARLPGAVWLYSNLNQALRQAWDDPSSTYLPDGTTLGPDRAATARAYAAALSGLAGRPAGSRIAGATS